MGLLHAQAGGGKHLGVVSGRTQSAGLHRLAVDRRHEHERQ
ncbi:MAG: hypothetical protein ACE5I1_09140 [bacterium]